jgi:cytoskeletal protein RodZ
MNRLKLLRTKSNLTLRELSKHVNIRNATLNLIENNKKNTLNKKELHLGKGKRSSGCVRLKNNNLLLLYQSSL